MTRQLEFKSVPNSFDGEILLTEINVEIVPYTAYVQTGDNGSLAYVDLPVSMPEETDTLIAEIVARHIRRQLSEYRDEAFEALRVMGRLKELAVKLDALLYQYKRSPDYKNSQVDRIIDTVRDMLKTIIKGV